VGSYFGGSFGSRLMKAIRIEQGNTYGVSGTFRANRFGGTFEVSTFSKTASTAETVRNLLQEIRGLAEHPPTAEELALHRRFFIGSAAARFETAGQISRQLARISLNGLPLDYVERTFAAIGRADAAQCASLVRRFVDPQRILIVVVGDAERIGPELRTIAPVSMVDRSGKPGPLRKPD
jgi:zinc protease